MTWWRRVLRRRALERELDAELRDHIEREVAKASAPDNQKPTCAAGSG